MRFLITCFTKDLRRQRRDPASLVLSASIPLAVTLLMRFAFGGGGGSTPTAHLLVADRDSSFVSGFLVGSFSGGYLAEVIRAEPVDESTGRERIGKGDASALLVIPPGFGQAVLEGDTTRLELITNPSQRILPGIIRETLTAMTDAVFYLQQLLGEPLRIMAQGPPPGMDTYPDAYVAALSVQINRRMQRIAPYLIPPVLDLEVVNTEEKKDAVQMSFAALMLPGMLFMVLLFAGQGASDDIWREKLKGTLSRSLAAPGHLAAFLAGKTLAGAATMTGVGALGLGVGAWLFGVEVRSPVVAVLWLAGTGLGFLLLMTSIQLLASSPRGGNVLTSILLFPLIMIGGSFFPLEVMPDWMAAAGRWTPNGWALEVLKGILRGTADEASLAADTAVLLGALALLFAFSLARLRGFARR